MYFEIVVIKRFYKKKKKKFKIQSYFSTRMVSGYLLFIVSFIKLCMKNNGSCNRETNLFTQTLIATTTAVIQTTPTITAIERNVGMRKPKKLK